MTPGGRAAAAIDILDQILAGMPAEQALTRWARGHRFAGSGDRAAIRDHVFDALRRRRSSAHLGGAETGRGVMIGLLRGRGIEPADMFDGQGHAPPVLSADERTAPSSMPERVALDCPEAFEADLRRSLGADFAPIMTALRDRAPVFLRVNLARSSVADAQAALASEGMATRSHPLSSTALEVLENPRKLRKSRVFVDGLVELQDAASQAAADLVPVPKAGVILDYCAGGGGKALALAARGARVVAHDANPARMGDIAARADRAGVADRVTIAEVPRGAFDSVVVDAPCTGSGAWRRNPDAKWRMTRDDVNSLIALQARILQTAAGLVSPSGALTYITCSLLDVENHKQIDDFLSDQDGWTLDRMQRFTPIDGGDGFFVAVLMRL